MLIVCPKEAMWVINTVLFYSLYQMHDYYVNSFGSYFRFWVQGNSCRHNSGLYMQLARAKPNRLLPTGWLPFSALDQNGQGRFDPILI